MERITNLEQQKFDVLVDAQALSAVQKDILKAAKNEVSVKERTLHNKIKAGSKIEIEMEDYNQSLSRLTSLLSTFSNAGHFKLDNVESLALTESKSLETNGPINKYPNIDDSATIPSNSAFLEYTNGLEEELKRKFVAKVKVQEARFREWEMNLVEDRERKNKELDRIYNEVEQLRREVNELERRRNERS